MRQFISISSANRVPPFARKLLVEHLGQVESHFKQPEAINVNDLAQALINLLRP